MNIIASWLSRVVSILSVFAFPVAAQAALVFTINGNIQNDNVDLGYTNGQAVTFTLVLNDYAPTTPTGFSFLPEVPVFGWTDYNSTPSPNLWSYVTGTGVDGTYAPPLLTGITVEYGTSSNLVLGNNDPGELLINMGASIVEPTGLTINGLPFFQLTIGRLAGANFADVSAGPLPDPTVYFSDYLGTYVQSVDSLAGGTIRAGDITVNGGADAPAVNFLVTSFSITTAIPEPATDGVLAGLGVLGLVMVLRRKKRIAL
jgi:hypothetical protein